EEIESGLRPPGKTPILNVPFYWRYVMPSPKPRVAILEDHQDTREMLRLALDNDFSIRDFQDASELLSVMEEENFSAIVADIMLPGLDGYGFVRTLRRDSRFRDLCVIAVTALAMANDREKGIAAGFTDYLVKPIDPREIAEVVWRCLQAKAPGTRP